MSQRREPRHSRWKGKLKTKSKPKKLVLPNGQQYDKGDIMTISDFVYCPEFNGRWKCVAWISYKEVVWKRYTWWMGLIDLGKRILSNFLKGKSSGCLC